jgi:protein-tyrosine phosphatase
VVRIAMVCLGNICRSPMAAAVAQALVSDAGLSDRVQVESFGTAAFHIGEPIDPRAEAALRRRGWTARRHRARRLGPDDVHAADLVLCADHSNEGAVRRLAGDGEGGEKVRMLRSFDPGTDNRDDEVPDPWGGGGEDFDRALELVERACRGLVDQLAGGGV